ncbi:MAG TPA: TolC family protein [Paraburkholderia sp.]
MTTFRIRLATLALVSAPALAAAQQVSAGDGGARPISLAEAVQLAKLNSPISATARNQLRVGKLAEMNALGQYLPNIRVGASAGNSSGASFFQGQFVPYQGNPWNYGRQYGGSILLFDGGQRYYSYRATQANQRANEETETTQNYVVTTNVKTQYYQVLLAHELEAAGASALQAAEAAHLISSSKVRIGALPRSDSLKTAVTIGTARLAILNAQAQVRDANAALTRLVASNVPVTAILADTADVPRIDVDDASLFRMAEDGPGVRQARAIYEAAKQNHRATVTSQLIPQVSANYTYSTGNSSPNFNWGGGPAQSKNTNYGFSVGYNIFNGFARELQTMQATVAEDNAEIALRDARLLAHSQLAQLIDQYRLAAQTIELQQLQIAAGSEDLAVTQARYAVGQNSLVDLLTSQTALDQQRSLLVNARYTARTAKAAIEAFIGRDLK